MPQYSFNSLVFPFFMSMWKNNPCCSTPSLSGEENNGTKTLAGTFLQQHFHPVPPEGKRRELRCLGTTHPVASVLSRGDTDVPKLGPLLCSLQPHPPPQLKIRFFSWLPESPAHGLIFILPICPQTYPGISTVAPRSSPIWGNWVCFLWQYGFNEQRWEPVPSNSCNINDGTFSSAMLPPRRIAL